jgi:hypothetical protein
MAERKSLRKSALNCNRVQLLMGPAYYTASLAHNVFERHNGCWCWCFLLPHA